MNIDQNIYEIIAAKSNGEELTDNETIILENWMNESPDNRKTLQYFKEIFLNKEDIGSFQEINTNNAWNKHLKRVNASKSLSIRTLLKYAAIILPLVIASSLFFNWDKLNISQGTDYCNLLVPKGQVKEIVLADGSKVWLNSDSQLKYPSHFNGDTREVYLRGEAYFSITKNKQKPFIVNSDLMDIKVLGTEFNLSCYEESQKVEATLYEGKIAYKTNNNKGILEPGFQAVLDKKSNKVEVRKVIVSQYTSWKEGIYLFDGINIEELAIKISRWYNVEVIIKDDSVKKMEFTGAIEKNKSVEFIIELLEETNSVKCKLEDSVLLIDAMP